MIAVQLINDLFSGQSGTWKCRGVSLPVEVLIMLVLRVQDAHLERSRVCFHHQNVVAVFLELVTAALSFALGMCCSLVALRSPCGLFRRTSSIFRGVLL